MFANSALKQTLDPLLHSYKSHEHHVMTNKSKLEKDEGFLRKIVKTFISLSRPLFTKYMQMKI
jgi:hypothetical protein